MRFQTLLFTLIALTFTTARLAADDAPPVAMGEIAGTVTDESGQPLEGALVHCWTWYPGHQTKTDKAGRFDLKGLEKDGPIELRISLAGYSPWYQVNQPTGAGDLRITLNNKTFFQGTILKPDGQPLPGALVRADSGPKKNQQVFITHVWTETKADEQGHYKLFVAPDKYVIEVRDPNIGIAHVFANADPNQGITQDLQLQQGFQLVINCLDIADKQPIPDVHVHVAYQKGWNAVSDKGGQAILQHLAAGKIEISFESKTCMRWCIPDAAEASQREIQSNHSWSYDGAKLDPSQLAGPLTLYMEKGMTCSGHVIDPQGNPVAGAIVVTNRVGGYADSIDQTDRFTAHTKPDGSFTFTVPACEDQINLIAHDGDYEQWRHWANGVSDPFDAVSGSTHNDITMKLTSPATIRGQVVDSTGAPTPDTSVRAINADDRDSRGVAPIAHTDRNGNFELKFVRPGDVLVQVEPFFIKEPGFPAPPAITSEQVTVSPGETKVSVRVTKPPSNQPSHPAGL